MLKGKIILLGVCACTPAYQAADIVMALRNEEADVKVIMTEHATNFVSPLILQSLSKNPVQVDQFAPPAVWDKSYQSWTMSGDLLLLAPASADMIGKAANGIADDLLSTNVLSFEGPKLIAMNMSPMLYRNAAVQRNVRQLANDGYYFIDNGNPNNPSGIPGVGQIVDAVIRCV
ncbi:MAG: flavoprotein [Clostridiales bacterium]|nr:flavoprotein [Lachnospiraceae bacterium]MCD7922026.1 flavoprotein [Clostridiales bacterium]MCD8108737.1 flavoprotein [Clostridiales bacterium]